MVIISTMFSHDLPPLFEVPKGYRRTFRLLNADAVVIETIVVDELGIHVNFKGADDDADLQASLDWIQGVIFSVREELGV